MKIEKKHIVILIVVAVVAYILWKRYKSSQAVDSVKTVDTKDDVELILNAIGANTAEKAHVRKFYKNVKASDAATITMNDKAADNGLTFEQQIVCDGIWTYYIDTDGHWKDDRGWQLTKKVKNL